MNFNGYARNMKNKITFLFLSLLPLVASAQDKSSQSGVEQESFFWILLQAIFALALVIGGIFLIVWVLKQFMNRSQSGYGATSNEFRVVKQIPIAPKQSLYAVRFLDDLLVIGSSESGLTQIETYRDFDQWEVFERSNPKLQKSFKQIFMGKLGRSDASDRSQAGVRS